MMTVHSPYRTGTWLSRARGVRGAVELQKKMTTVIGAGSGAEHFARCELASGAPLLVKVFTVRTERMVWFGAMGRVERASWECLNYTVSGVRGQCRLLYFWVVFWNSLKFEHNLLNGT